VVAYFFWATLYNLTNMWSVGSFNRGWHSAANTIQGGPKNGYPVLLSG